MSSALVILEARSLRRRIYATSRICLPAAFIHGVIPNARVFTSGRRDLRRHEIEVGYPSLHPKHFWVAQRFTAAILSAHGIDRL
jgi:hypothetical protein